VSLNRANAIGVVNLAESGVIEFGNAGALGSGKIIVDEGGELVGTAMKP
jgi:hypothetical protein